MEINELNQVDYTNRATRSEYSVYDSIWNEKSATVANSAMILKNKKNILYWSEARKG